jgi:glyoxylase-like metal-dependent hydrolase (beta-lactamase superfamily II)
MRTTLCLLLALTSIAAYSQSNSRAAQVVEAAAEALGGKQRIESVKTLKIVGYGQLAYQDGGGNISSSPLAPQKWININAHQRTIDFAHERMRLQQRNVQDFVFAYERNMTGAARVDQALDGDVAYNVGPDGKPMRASEDSVRARRIEMLNNPLSIVRAALHPQAKLQQVRSEGSVNIVDFMTKDGAAMTLAVDARTHLPAWVSWVAPHANFGDVTYRTNFVGYQREGNRQDAPILLPSGYNTVSDFRNVVQHKLYVDKYVIDAAGDSLPAASQEVIAAAAPPDAARPNVEVVPVAKGVWYLKGRGNSTLFEFDDHLVLFEAYGSEANTLAIIARARETVPNKPLTYIIVSHHHIDHTGGLRAAVSEGLTVITNRANVDYVREVTSRPAKRFPDALERSGRRVNVIAVDDRLELKDGSMRVQVLRVIGNSHFADGLIAYVPRDRLVAEGDLVDEGWNLVWWGNSYPDTVNFWKLQVEKDLPVHGNIHTYAEVIAMLKQQTHGAQLLCARAQEAQLSVQGCPVSNTLDHYAHDGTLSAAQKGLLTVRP